MPLLIALWLAVLGALATPAARDVRAGPVATVDARHSNARAAGTVARRGGARPLHEALRVARPVVGVVAATAEATGGHGPSAAMLASEPRLSGEAAFAIDVRARSLEASHAVAARGGVLPYFPTAPPLQG